MIAVLVVAVLLATTVLGGHRALRRTATSGRSDAVRRILLPFTGTSISGRAFDAAVRLARVEHATLMPCYLATVPLTLPLDAPLPAQCHRAMALLETIEQRALAQEVEVDARIMRGRTFRDALRRALASEPVDRVIVSATDDPGGGFTDEDLVWLLRRADAEVLILRPAPEDHRQVAAAVAGHF